MKFDCDTVLYSYFNSQLKKVNEAITNVVDALGSLFTGSGNTAETAPLIAGTPVDPPHAQAHKHQVRPNTHYHS